MRLAYVCADRGVPVFGRKGASVHAQEVLRALGRHVRVDVFYSRLRKRTQAWFDLGGTLLLLLPFCVFGILLSWPAVRNSWRVRETSPDPGGLARYPIKSVILVAFVLLMLQGIAWAWRRARDLKDGA